MAYNESKLSKEFTEFTNKPDSHRHSQLTGEQAHVLQRMAEAPAPESAQYVPVRYFDELEVANKNVRFMLNYKLNEMKQNLENLMQSKDKMIQK